MSTSKEKDIIVLEKAMLAAIDEGPGTVDLAKALFVGEENGEQSNNLNESSTAGNQIQFTKGGTIQPIFDPMTLALIYENSSVLRSCVDAYITNIDSFGHHFAPLINVSAMEVDEKIRDAMRAERKYFKTRTPDELSPDGKSWKDLSDEPADNEVAKRRDEIKIEMREEHEMLAAFFENCSPTVPFTGPEGLRGLTRQDIEVFGNGYWEILRNGAGEIAQFNRLEARTIRLLPLDREPASGFMYRKVSTFASHKVPVNKRFRTFCQSYEASDQRVYFKEFGDPRFVSSRTGNAYNTVDEMHKADGESNATPATEILPFKITSVRSQYGAPRWIGAMCAVLGTRQAEEVNFLYFENRSVPPMAILVSGGRLNKETVSRLEDYIANQIRGKRNFHKVMILEAESAESADKSVGPNNGKMKIELKPLTDAQQKDGLFQQYDERNADKVGQMFRLPRLLRGDVRDFNRSTAVASVDFAEIQVFGPIREQFDWMMNTLVLPELKVRYHKYKSNAPTVRDPEGLSTMIKDLVTASVLTPEEARALARGVFNEDLRDIKAPWTQQPVALTLAGRRIEDDLNTDEDESDEYGIDTFNQAGGMSAPGAGATQQSLGVDQTKKDAGGGDLSSGDLASGGGALVPAQGIDRKRPKRSAKQRALAKVRQYMVKAAIEAWKIEKKNAEVLTLPAELFQSVFIPDGK